jgi:hypothetical protein
MAVIPMLAYEDGAAAIDWLSTHSASTRRALPTTTGSHHPRELQTAADGHARHAVPDYVSPKRLRELSAEARKMSEVPVRDRRRARRGRRRRRPLPAIEGSR